MVGTCMISGSWVTIEMFNLLDGLLRNRAEIAGTNCHRDVGGDDNSIQLI
jgi:hypothetical protein